MADLKETDSSLKESEDESEEGLMGLECFKQISDYTPFKFNEKLINNKSQKYFAFSCFENTFENMNPKNKSTNTNSLNEENTTKKEVQNKASTKKEKEKNEINRNSTNSNKNIINANNANMGYLGISTDDMREIDEDEGEEDEEAEDEDDFQDFEDELGINKFNIRPNNCLKIVVVNIIETYDKIKPNFYIPPVKEEEKMEVLTDPSEPKKNNGKDNENDDLIVRKNDKIKSDKNTYIVIDLLGTGISGQTFKVLCQNNNKYYALKIIKNIKKFSDVCYYEYKLMKRLNEKDKKDEFHIIRTYGYFEYNNHLCIVNQLMQKTLLEIIRANNGLSLTSIRFISKQILKGVEFIHNANYVHTDLKPENILLTINDENNDVANTKKERISISQNTDLISKRVLVKIADFGSTYPLKDLKQVTSDIQSMYYRAPEVIIGLELDEKVDVWSIGCILIELFLSSPILPGTSNYDQLNKISTVIGEIPQDLIDKSRRGNKYFINEINKEKKYRLKTYKEYFKEFPKEKPKEYYDIPENIKNLDSLVDVKRDTIKSKNSRMKSLNNSSLSINSTNIKDDLASFIHLLKGMLQIDPSKRWSCQQCLKHPFITKEKLSKLIQFENEILVMSNSFNRNNNSHIQNNYRSMNKSFNYNNYGNKANLSFGNFNHQNLRFFPNNQRYSNPNNINNNVPNNENNNNNQMNNNMNYNYNNINQNNYNQRMNSSFSYNMNPNNFMQNQGMPPISFIPNNYFPNFYIMNNPNNFYQNNNNNPYFKQNNSYYGLPPQNLNYSFGHNMNQNFNMQNFQNRKKSKYYNNNNYNIQEENKNNNDNQYPNQIKFFGGKRNDNNFQK